MRRPRSPSPSNTVQGLLAAGHVCTITGFNDYFSLAENRMLNSTLKMVRGRITEFYKTRIDYAFTVEGKDVLNHQNRMIIRRLEEA